MRFLLDTNTCIDFLNGKSEKLKHKFEEITDFDIVLCSIVKAELYLGVEKSKNKNRNKTKLETFISNFQSLGFLDDEAKVYAEIRNELETKGEIIGPNDLLIASIAKSNNLILVTHNVKEFYKIEGLKVEDWH